MTEYVCDLPIDGIASFGIGSFDVPVREEIVRCRDCKWATPSEEPEGQELDAYSCAHWAGYADSRYEELWVDGDDYCSHGERRES